MSEKKIKKKLVDFIEKCVEKYIDEHLADLKRKLLNMDGFKSDEEYRNLQVQFEEVNDKNKDLQTDIENLRSENDGLKQKQEVLQNNLDTADKKQKELEQKNKDLVVEREKINGEKEDIEKKLAECEKNLNNARLIIENKRNKISQMEKEICYNKEEIYKGREHIETLFRKLECFTKSYGKIDDMYKMYQKFDEDIREELRGIFGSADTPIQFFCGALQENHLDNFWEYICSKINSGKIDRDMEGMLNRLFDFCFDMVNISQPKPMYKRLQVQAGFDFDNNYMIKTSSSSQLGIIKEIKLEGYVYASSNKVVKRSLVQVESED